MISSQQAIHLEDKFGAHNYHPLPVVLSKGKGVFVWDPEGNKYFDFLSAYSAVNQGHCHPKITETLIEQSKMLTLTSRAFYNNVLGEYEMFMSEYFGLDKILPMNTGAEAVETAIKICRKWGYEKKGIDDQEAVIIVCDNNFHGRTTTIISFSNDPDAKKNFGPYTKGFVKVVYDNIESLKEALELPNVVGFLVEPIQGEAGVVVPDSSYIKEAARLCKEKNVLFIADEIQTGIARTGSLLAICGDCDCLAHCERGSTYTKPDILILGKALSGGAYPVSAVLTDNEIMEVLKPGQHGSTYGGNPLACKVAMSALSVVDEENLAQNARRLGKLFRDKMQELAKENELFVKVRGKGLLNAVIINDAADSDTAWRFCIALKENGLLAKPTHGNIIRFAPPLVITEKQLIECVDIIKRTLAEFDL